MSEVDLRFVGATTEPFRVEVERGHIRRFADAIGDPNPLFRDPDHARRYGYADVVAPPTFATVFRPPADPPWIQELDRRRIVAGEMSFQNLRPIVAGMTLSCRMRLVAVDAKVGSKGTMQLLRQQLEGENDSGDVIFVAGRTTIYRPKDQSLT
jgi:acyl dehydratase